MQPIKTTWSYESLPDSSRRYLACQSTSIRANAQEAFVLSFSVTSFEFKFLLAAKSVLNSLTYLAEVKRSLQQFTEHDFGDILHFLSV